MHFIAKALLDNTTSERSQSRKIMNMDFFGTRRNFWFCMMLDWTVMEVNLGLLVVSGVDRFNLKGDFRTVVTYKPDEVTG